MSILTERNKLYAWLSERPDKKTKFPISHVRLENGSYLYKLHKGVGSGVSIILSDVRTGFDKWKKFHPISVEEKEIFDLLCKPMIDRSVRENQNYIEHIQKTYKK